MLAGARQDFSFVLPPPVHELASELRADEVPSVDYEKSGPLRCHGPMELAGVLPSPSEVCAFAKGPEEGEDKAPSEYFSEAPLLAFLDPGEVDDVLIRIDNSTKHLFDHGPSRKKSFKILTSKNELSNFTIDVPFVIFQKTLLL